MTTATNSENLGKYNRRYSLIVRQIPTLSLSNNLVIKVKNLSTNSNQIA